ncbi:MAG TPA: 2-oxoacid:acceptor oxidoreductase family protein [Acidimicrobiales bacterium]
MERQVLMTGIGGQGVQLAAEVLARAALAEGRDVQLFGSYGGMMRGGNTDATLVMADDRVESPPTVGSAWAALVMHHEYAVPVVRKVRAGGVVVVNMTVCEGGIVGENLRVVEVPASDLAVDAGNVIAAGMVMLGAMCTATRVVSLDALHQAARVSVPAYRTQHLELNERALEMGAGAVTEVVDDAWFSPSVVELGLP